MINNIKYFIEHYDFDMLSAWIDRADPVEVLLNPIVLGVIVTTFALITYQKTTYLGQKLVIYIPVLGWLFVTGVILKNDIISNAGPFAMAMISFFIIVGWMIWTRLLND